MLPVTGVRPEFSGDELAVFSTGAGTDTDILDLKRLVLQVSDPIVTPEKPEFSQSKIFQFDLDQVLVFALLYSISVWMRFRRDEYTQCWKREIVRRSVSSSLYTFVWPSIMSDSNAALDTSQDM